MKAVMISIQPKWCELIANGKKMIEIRKTRPKINTPFKCYIYCTSSDIHSGFVVGGGSGELIHCCNYKTAITVGGELGNGKVIGEFVCDGIQKIEFFALDNPKEFEKIACLTCKEIIEYLKGVNGYAWHISDLKIYDKPKELGEFKYLCQPGYNSLDNAWCYREYGNRIINCKYNDAENHCCNSNLTKPPQSWGYVDEQCVVFGDL